MIRMSMLRNYPVILDERQIGLLQSVRFDQARKRVCALVVSCGMRGKRLIPLKNVRMIADGFILVNGLEKHRRSDQQQIWPFVRDTTGMLVGRITDYAIERASMRVLAIEIIRGYWPAQMRRRIWIHEYNPVKDSEDIIIPGVLHDMPSFSMEGDRVCEYRP